MRAKSILLITIAIIFPSQLMAKEIWRDDFERKENISREWRESYYKKEGRKLLRVPTKGIGGIDTSNKVSGENSLRVSPAERRGITRGICLDTDLPENQGGVLSAYFYDSGDSYGGYNIAVETYLERGKASLYALGRNTHYNFKCNSVKGATPFRRKKGWHKVQFVLGAGELKCYLDGKLAGKVKGKFSRFKSLRLGSGDWGIRSPVYFDEVVLDNDPNSIKKDLFQGQSVDIKTDRVGNLFYDNEQIIIHSLVSNYGKELEKLDIVAELRDGDDKKILAVIKKTVDLPAHGEKESDFAFDIKGQKGLYVCRIALKKNDKVLAENKIRYCVSIPAEELKKDSRSPLGVHFVSRRDRIPEIGWKWQRIYDHKVSWKMIEKEPGKFHWELADEIVNEAHNQNREILFNLGFPPVWASSAPDEIKKKKSITSKNYPPKDMAIWKRFVETVVKRYKDKVKYWEIWNEPNAPYLLGTKKDYLEILKNAYESIKKVDPEASVVGISATGRGAQYIKDLLNMGALDYMDIVSSHFYMSSLGCPEGEKTASRMRMAADFREIARRKGKELPVWDTESSYQLAGLGKDGLPMKKQEVAGLKKLGKLAKNQCSDNDIANWSVRKYIILYTRGMNRFFWHYGFPMVYADGCASAACATIPAMTRELTGAGFEKELNMGNENLRGYLFSKEKGDPGFFDSLFGDSKEYIAALWAVEDQATAELRVKDAKVFDRFGNETSDKVENGKLSLVLSENPVYIHLSSPEIETAASILSLEMKDLINQRNFDVQVNIDNKNESPLKGLVKILMPKKYQVSPAQIITIPPKKNQKVIFQVKVPKKLHSDRCILKAEFICENSESKYSIQKTVSLKIPEDVPKRKREIIVDGNLREWREIKNEFTLRSRDQVSYGLPINDPALMDMAVAAGRHFWEGAHDLSGKFKLAWDEKYLYISLLVKDPVVINETEKQPYNGDCVEIFLDTRSIEKQGDKNEVDKVYQIFFVPPVKKEPAKAVFLNPAFARNGIIDSKTPLIIAKDKETDYQKLAAKFADLRFASKRINGGYTMEIRFPFAAALGVKAEPGKTIGFDLSINDSDHQGEKRKTVMVWRGSVKNHKDPSLLWKLKLK